MATPRTDGIDTSHYQDLSFDTGPLPALKFAMHKVSEGGRYRDPDLFDFTTRYRNSPQVEHVGFYHWLRSDWSVEAQVQNFLGALGSTVGGVLAGEFVVIDWERTYVKAGAVTKGVIGRNLTRALPDPTPADVEKFRAAVAGFLGDKNRVAVYSAPWVNGFTAWRKANPHTPLFLANYRTNKLLPFNGWAESERWNATAWQWSSSAQVPGIVGRCDVNQARDYGWFDYQGVKAS